LVAKKIPETKFAPTCQLIFMGFPEASKVGVRENRKVPPEAQEAFI
jgi:hypothetical protein